MNEKVTSYIINYGYVTNPSTSIMEHSVASIDQISNSYLIALFPMIH